MTKHTFTALLALTGTLCFHPVVRAADAPETARPAAGVREQLQQLATDLKLSAEQQERIRTIARDRLEKLRELRQDASVAQAEKMDKIKAFREELASEIRKVLTPDQLELWKAKQRQLLGAAQGPMEQLQDALKQLNLTEEQKEKLKTLYQEQLGKLRELRQDTSLSLQAKLEKLQAMRKEITPEMKKVLDAAQFQKWEKTMDHWLENLKQRLQAQGQE